MTDRSDARARRRTAHIRVLLSVAIAVGASAALAQRSVPPAQYRPLPERKAEVQAQFVLPGTAKARRITLPPPTPEEEAAAVKPSGKATPASPLRNKRDRLAVGFARIVPATQRSLRLADLDWQTTATGSRAAQIALNSPGAAGLRLGVELTDPPRGLAVRFRGSASGAPVYGPFTGATIAQERVYWSPPLEGETGTLELELPAGVAPGDGVITLPMLSHLYAAGRSLRAFGLNIGSSGACEVDIACLDPALQQQLATASNAVARMMVTVQGSTYLCTGTLLNDSLTSFTPYFLTADHCLEDVEDPAAGRGTAAASAATINTYWFFQAAACGSLATPDYKLLVGGAKLLARSVDYDWALLQLKLAPPSGVTYSAWNANGPMATGTAADAIHHPSGDLKKFSRGNVLAYRTFGDGSSFVQMGWTNGVTEHGSSGSGLFTFNAATDYFELRGTLSGGSSACDFQQGTDYYSRLDAAYPLVAEYLVPNATNVSKTVAVVEYYNALEDNYFITADPYEIAGRDNGSPAGWVRTGYRFLAYTDPAVAPAGAQPVCRLFAPSPYGNTRFYSASPQECASMLAQPDLHFVSESAAAFYLQVPSLSGACPSSTRPVYRFLDGSGFPRRRYTAEVDLRDALAAAGGWAQEGAGSVPNRVAMCAPKNGSSLPAPAVANYQGLWWNAPAGSESGWGINLNHQGDTIFATWFTYDVDGSPLWLVVAANRTAANVYSGTLYRGTGPAFNAVPFDPAQVVGTPVGTATFTFSDAVTATFAYTIDGVTAAKSITREVFAYPVPSCTWNAPIDPAQATNYQGLWWRTPAGSESGWGINLTHQGSTIFATWFTYGLDGKPLWLAVAASQSAPNVYTGELYSGTGPAYNSAKFDPAKVVATPVGSATFTFIDGNHATFDYTVSIFTQSKSLTRQVFAPPGTVCR